MKIKDIQRYLMDTVVIYKEVDSERAKYVDIYSGSATNIPNNILNMELRVVGAKEKGTLDVEIMKD